jgi:penicillin amidase
MQKTKQIFKRGCSYFSPGIKRDVCDAKGNIAWWATGKLYKHNDGVETHFILDGSSGKTILLNIWISKESVGNVEWNFVYSANNQAERLMFLYPGYYLPETKKLPSY